MKTSANLTRRDFLKTTATATSVAAHAPSVLAAKSPNETLGVGCIGLGTRGGDLINAVEEAKRMRDAIKRSQIVFQLGHQARASTCALQAKELLSSEPLGPITRVRTGRFMSSDPAHPTWRWYGYYSQWNRPDPAQVVKDVDWERWLGPAPKRP